METTALFGNSLDHAERDHGGVLPLVDLRWRAAYQRALNRMPSEVPRGQHLIQLLSWPNLSRLPCELVVPVTRICALLWRKPTVSFLVARVLEAPQRETAALLEVLQEFGHVASPRQNIQRVEVTAQEQDGCLRSESPAGSNMSMIRKLWLRLTGY